VSLFNIMTGNRRIFLNITATYCRSLYALMLGLLSARWLYLSLGNVDYGLLGVVAGLTGFISFFNGVLASAIGRFYAVSVGLSKRVGSESSGLDECRAWFNTALTIHSIVPVALIICGYPIGHWAIRSWLNIPIEKVPECERIFQFVCVTCFVGMFNVPFNAMYIAKQYIAELTIYSFATSTLNFFFLYYMITHPGAWLVRYSFFTMVMTVVPQIIICVRALFIFKECKVMPGIMFNARRLRRVLSYSCWQFFGAAGSLVRNQGVTLIVNKFFGPIWNSTMGIANSVAGYADVLSASLTGAFSPAIMNLEGEGAREKMLLMACRASKFGSLLCLVFLLPLTIEIPAIIDVWLKTPPPMAATACYFMFATLLLDQFARGINISVCASGKVALFNIALGGFHILSLPVIIVVVLVCGGGFLSVLSVLVSFKAIGLVAGLFIAKRNVNYPVMFLLKDIIVPLILTVCLSLSTGFLVKKSLCDWCYLRMLLDFTAVELPFLFVSWFWVLNRSEREYVRGKLCLLMMRIRGV